MTATTTAPDRVALTANVERLSAALSEAQADVALLRRLKDAEKTAARITDELTAAQDKLVKANADEMTANRKAAYAAFRSVRIHGDTPEDQPGSILATTYTIIVERMRWNMTQKASVWQDDEYRSFACMAPDAFGYLMEMKPEAIPAAILALAPGDHHKAMKKYLQGMRRGYLAS